MSRCVSTDEIHSAICLPSFDRCGRVCVIQQIVMVKKANEKRQPCPLPALTERQTEDSERGVAPPNE